MKRIKIKNLHPGNVDQYLANLQRYEDLREKMTSDSITWNQYENYKNAKFWLKTTLWADRHMILAAYEALLEKQKKPKRKKAKR